ncbi:MAG: putative lipid II flippase FtsW [Candidatus Nanopelagicaceae bacterium]
MMRKPVTRFYGIVLPALLLSLLGLLMVFSASSVIALQESRGSVAIVAKQFLLFIVGVTLAALLMRTPPRFLQRISTISLIASLGSLALPLLPGIGKEVNGNANWISIAGFTLQPSEFAKLGMLLWIAGVLSKHEELITQGLRSDLLKNLLPGLIAIIGLIVAGKDLGTAIIFAAIAAGVLFISGVSMRYFFMGLGGIGLFIVVMILTQPNRIYRIKALLDPFSEENYQHAGWQPAHSIMAIASGGIFGSGLGAGKQKWGNLAEAHTDFIFAVIGEEMGLLGSLTVLFLFFFLIMTIFKVALKSHTLFEKYLVAGIGIWMVVQIAINIGSVTGLIPVIGVTLPLISYGGSSLVSTLMALGVVLNIALRDPAVKEELAQRLSRTLK